MFSGFVSRMENVSERCLFSLKYFVFGKALEHYSALAGDPDNPDPEILLRIGRCHKIRGNFESAINILEEASRLRREDAVILAELADCYSLVNETRAAKVFFREAFFLDCRGVELAYLESPLIQRLVAKLRERFSEAGDPGLDPRVRHDLRPFQRQAGAAAPGAGQAQAGHLPAGEGRGAGRGGRGAGRASGRPGSPAATAPVARLINHYFWLIDHYLASGEERPKIEEVLERIKALDPVVFKEYTN